MLGRKWSSEDSSVWGQGIPPSRSCVTSGLGGQVCLVLHRENPAWVTTSWECRCPPTTPTKYIWGIHSDNRGRVEAHYFTFTQLQLLSWPDWHAGVWPSWVLQSAYKPGQSTETALLWVHNDILTNMDGQSVTMLIMLDLSAAFDTIDHRVLLDRMESTIGFTGVPLTWFASYLSHRSQSIQINQVVSMLSILLLFGVPQGSVLGPLLFLIYILPLGVIIRSSASNFTYMQMTL